ncbi:MAG: tetratricopeptide repeat protein [Gemmatimonadaceae bacterium]|nr:tetratricopeptide repeat protein [Gemmatimonadaceae bacterium]
MRVTASLASIYWVWMMSSALYLHFAPSASEYRTLASEAFDREEYAASVEFQDKVLEIAAMDYHAHYWKGRALSKEEDYERALVSFDLALMIRPEELAALDGKARALSGLGRFEEALSVLNQIQQRDSTSVRVQYNIAFCLQHLGRREEALTILRGVVAADPGWMPGHIRLGHMLDAAGRPRQALAAYARATAIDSTNDEVRYHLAATHLHLGDRAEAIEILRRMAGTNPSLATEVSADSSFMDLTEEELSLLSSD